MHDNIVVFSRSVFNMKFTVHFGILFIVLVTVAYSEDADWSGEELNCVNELKLNKNSIRTINKQIITPEDNTDFNNFLACYWKKKGILDKHGEIDFEKLDDLLFVQILQEFGGNLDEAAGLVTQIFENAISECKAMCIRGKTHGELAAKVQNCIARAIQREVLELAEN